MNINEVFKTQGQPTLTYVNRNNGEFEDKLANAIDSKGLLCLLTGPSKTGKTTLCTKVANAKKLEILQVRCHANLSPSELWRCALEKVNFERVKEVQSQLESSVNSGAELSGNIGWKWLAGLSGKFSTGISSTKTESEIRDKILAEANPDHLLPILKKLPVLFVVEDFHYLLPETQTEVFQQWKTFIDNEVSIIVIGTTHHAADIAFSNKDLIGRIAHIELGRWEQKDLETIAKKGFGHFGIDIPTSSLNILAKESVGLPIVMQSVCLQLLIENKVNSLPSKIKNIDLSKEKVYKALHSVATTRYSSFGMIYDRLSRGPRQNARKYNTYELVLSIFCDDPITFQLGREEIEQRLKKLPISEEKKPPRGSVSSMLNAIGTFQDKLDMQILEWSESNQRLYIIEPSFLFYLRWREEKSHQPSIYEFLSSLLDSKVGVFFKEVKPVGMGILSSAISSSKTLITDDSTNDEGEPDN